MKKLLTSTFFIVALLVLNKSAFSQMSQRYTQNDFTQLSWLAGTWQGSSDKGNEYQEIWTKSTNPGSMTGEGYIKTGGNWMLQEKLTLDLTPTGTIIYTVALVNNTASKGAIPFTMEAGSNRRALFTSKTNMWPKSITYVTQDETATGINKRVEGTKIDGTSSMDMYTLSKVK